MEKGKPQYLVLKRSSREKLYPGIWQIATGVIETSERATEAAVREVKEETGLSPERFWVVPHINSFYVPAEDAVHQTVFFASEHNKKSAVRLSKEHDEFRWLAFAKARSLLVWPGQKKGLEIVHDFIVGSPLKAALVEYPLP